MILSSTAATPATIATRLSLLLILSSVLVSAACYYPDGSNAADTACTDSTSNSTCCGPGYACVGYESSFFLCQATGEEIPRGVELIRGSCTDRSWRSSNCPSVCVDPDRDGMSGGNGVARCPGSDLLFYCMSDGLRVENCTTGYRLIQFIATPSVLTTIGVISTITSSSSSSTTSTLSTTGASAPGSGGTTKPNDGPVETSSSSSSNNNGMTIGIAVGVSIGALGLLVAGVFAWLLMRRRRNQQAADTDTNKRGPEPGGAYVSGPVEVHGNEAGSRFELPVLAMNANPTELDSQEKRR